MTSQFADQLLEDIVLQAPIVRAAQVVEGSGWTYDALDRARYIVLVADGNNDFHVAVVRTVFDSLLRKAEDPAVVALLRACGTLPQDPAATIHWQGFEDFRSEERRVGKECVSTGRSRWWQYHKKKKTTNQQ